MHYFDSSGPGWSDLEDPMAFLAKVNPIDGVLEVGEDVQVKACHLPFYESVELVAVGSEEWEENLRIFYLVLDEKPFRLNGSSPPIHEINVQAPVRIDADNALAYLVFFCLFVHGDDGPFYVLSDLKDPLLPDGILDESSEFSSIRTLFRKPRLFGVDDLGRFQASALIFYSNAVFIGDFLIAPSGMIEMVSDQPIAGDLPNSVQIKLTAK